MDFRQIGDAPIGHAGRRAAIREAIQEMNARKFLDVVKKYGAWHVQEAMREDATDEEASQLWFGFIESVAAVLHEQWLENVRLKSANEGLQKQLGVQSSSDADDIPF
jgi:hypothetical protein